MINYVYIVGSLLQQYEGIHLARYLFTIEMGVGRDFEKS
jgi:hypothetical protein